MRRITRRILQATAATAAAAFFVASTASAQSPAVGASFMVGVPTGEFSDTLDKVGFGLGVEVGYHVGTAPIEVGLQAGFMTYGSESRKEPWSTTIPDVTVDVETSNNIALGHLYLRLIPKDGVVRPFVDGKLGFSYLFTSTSVESEGAGEDGAIASSTNFDDGVFSYGGGAGALVLLWQNDRRGEGDEVGEVLLDLRVGYLAGGEAEYLTNGSMRREAGSVTYVPKKSRTDLIDARLGVQVRF
ncbi:MAG TPA: outer membrane beta-barrel protein [Candidatus Kapabacteria bacterium]|jgi:hypothetical protein|nr:outer membrane beta-barrel protein [Candidatus Kapabacteria bacterium]